jgi:hypothetical protein
MKAVRLIEVWIAEKRLPLSSNYFLRFYQRPDDGMSAIQT